MTVALNEPIRATSNCLDNIRGMLGGLNDEEIAQALREIETLSRKTQSVMLELVAEADSRGIAAAQGFGSTARLLAGMLRLSAADLRTVPQRQADALIELCERARAADEFPTTGGEPPHVTVTIDWDALRTGLGAATLDYGQLISAAAARCLACDCRLIPVVMGGDSESLDVGRAMRTVPMGIRRALVPAMAGAVFQAAIDHPEFVTATM